MQINIHSCIEGARAATGLAIVIDVLRASNTIIAALASGAKSIIPVGSLEEAYQLKQQYPNYKLFGERNGLPPKGFDHGNSPCEAASLDLTGNNILLTTSAGTQGIINCQGANEILIASFANVEAVATYILERNPAIVSLVAIGNNAIEPATEDEECALFLKRRLLGALNQPDSWRERILVSDGANRLRRLKQDDDLVYCLRLNTHSQVPRYEKFSGAIVNAI